MARPKKANTNEMATVKIESAFWKLIETETYSNITVLRVSQESGTNRNSFYYHYRDMDDLADKAFRNAIDAKASQTLLSTLLSPIPGSPGIVPDKIVPSVLHAARRVMLYAASDSPFLNNMVRDLLREYWFNALSIDEGKLSETEALQIKFIFAGLVAALGSKEVRDHPTIMPALSQTKVGKAAIETMKDISKAQHT